LASDFLVGTELYFFGQVWKRSFFEYQHIVPFVGLADVHYRGVGIEGITDDADGKPWIELFELDCQPFECSQFAVLLVMLSFVVVFKPDTSP
jgi:hypothetical protein